MRAFIAHDLRDCDLDELQHYVAESAFDLGVALRQLRTLGMAIDRTDDDGRKIWNLTGADHHFDNRDDVAFPGDSFDEMDERFYDDN